MGRYLCQLCYSVVRYGERHPCFFYKNDDEVYTVPPPNELEEKGRQQDTNGIPPGNSDDKIGDLRAAAQESEIEECKETNSRLTENDEQMSQMRVSRRKRNHCSIFPSNSLCGMKNRHLDSKSASLASAQGDGNKAKKSKDNRKIEGSSAETTRNSYSSNSKIPPNSAAVRSFSDAESISVPGPSGIRTQTHMKEKEKPFVCDVSGKILTRELHMQEHQRTHTGEKTFVCPTCSRKFTHRRNLMRHLLTHTGQKPFICDICSAAFYRKSNLETHLRIHSGEKPFKCAFCDMYFADRSNCNKHQQSMHAKKNNSSKLR